MFCLFPGNEEYEADVTFEYGGNGYALRHRFLVDANLTNSSTVMIFYLSDTALTTTTEFLVQDTNALDQENVVISAQKYFPGQGNYYTVCQGLTGDNGETAMELQQGYYYRWILERSGTVLLTTSPEILSDTELVLYIPAEVRGTFFEYKDNVAYSCTVDTVNNQITCTFSDTSGKQISMLLEAKRVLLYNRTDPFCSESSTETAGTLLCDYSDYVNDTVLYTLVGNYDGSLVTETYPWIARYIEPAVDWFWGESLGAMGIMMTFGMMLTLGLLGLYDPKVSIIFTTIGMVISYLFQLYTITFSSIILLVIVAGFIVYRMRS
jgi:hypothetical protein